MERGKKVVCINDSFTAIIKRLYRQLPIKGAIYTVREVSLGREKVAVLDADGRYLPGQASESVTVRILLEEVRNPVDPLHSDGQELGFNAERFDYVDTISEEEVLKESAGVGFAMVGTS